MKFRVPRPPRPCASAPSRVDTTPGYAMPVPPREAPKTLVIPEPPNRSRPREDVTPATTPPAMPVGLARKPESYRTQEIDLEQMDSVLSGDRRVVDHEWFGDDISDVAIEEYSEERRSVLVRVALALGVLSVGLTASALLVVA